MSELNNKNTLDEIRNFLATKGAIAEPLYPSDYISALLIAIQRELDYVADLRKRQLAALYSAMVIKAKYIDSISQDEDLSRFHLRPKAEPSENKKANTSTFRMGVRQSSRSDNSK